MKVADHIPVFAIAVVSQLTDTPIRMLREYEKHGLLRTKRVNGRRRYTACEIGFIKGHKACRPENCPFCPLFIVKTGERNNKNGDAISPLVYQEK